MKRRDLERRLRMAGCCTQTQRNQGAPGPEDPCQPRRELSPRPAAAGAGLAGSRRVLGSSRESTTAGLEPDFVTGRAERERRLHPLPWALPVPLRVHGRYSRAEIMAAFAAVNELGKPLTHQKGVLWHQASATDLLFITLNKSEALFSPSTRTRDLALGPSLFHWESQSTTTTGSPTGQRYIHHATRGSRVLLFVREQRKQDGRPGAPTEPFVCLGFATYESHEGERPMAIRWRLEREIPSAWLPVMALAV